MCCPADPLVKDFLNLIDSLNLEQSVNVPTHEYGHTLDLVLSYGISLGYVNVYDATFSDHNPVIFGVSLPCQSVRSCPPTCLRHMLNSSVISEFSRAFLKNHNISTFENPPLYPDPEPVL